MSDREDIDDHVFMHLIPESAGDLNARRRQAQELADMVDGDWTVTVRNIEETTGGD